MHFLTDKSRLWSIPLEGEALFQSVLYLSGGKPQTGNSPRQKDDLTEFCTQSDLRIGVKKNILSPTESTLSQLEVVRFPQKGNCGQQFPIPGIGNLTTSPSRIGRFHQNTEIVNLDSAGIGSPLTAT